MDDAAWMHNLMDKHSPQAEPLRLVHENLNTQTPGSWYEGLPPRDAFPLSQRCAPPSTPLQGAWRKRAAIELAALAKPCLARRLPTFERRGRAVLAWADVRTLDRQTVHGRFSQNDARDKCHRHDHKVQQFM